MRLIERIHNPVGSCTTRDHGVPRNLSGRGSDRIRVRGYFPRSSPWRNVHLMGRHCGLPHCAV